MVWVKGDLSGVKALQANQPLAVCWLIAQSRLRRALATSSLSAASKPVASSAQVARVF